MKTRSVFGWAHNISNKEEYFANLARMKINMVMLWNEFKPINAEEVVELAHSYGIEILWGYAWGWSTNCNTANLADLDNLSAAIVEEYETYYHGCGDGIYFQSFTEVWQDTIGGLLIAEAVTKLVNMTAGVLLERYPGLKLQFGLHANSVKNHMQYLAQVDPRVEIVWENCGMFPYTDEKMIPNLEEDIPYTDQIIDLRGKAPLGLVYKGQLTQDWSRNRFVHQAGPYILGDVHPAVRKRDEAIFQPAWRRLQTQWTYLGRYAWELTRHIYEKTGGDVNMSMAAMLSDGVWLPAALCAEMYWSCDKDDYDTILRRLLARPGLTLAN